MSLYDLDPNKIAVYGEAIVTNGLEVRHGIDGYGLVTRGLLWQLFDIFIDTDSKDAITTSWSNSESVLSTAWTDTQYGIYGEYTP